MPGGDRTGPMGAGPMTGRGAGYCAGYAVPGYANPAPGYSGMGRAGYGRGGGFGRGFGRGFGGGGFGRGRGNRNMYYATGQPGWARGYAAPVPPAPEEVYYGEAPEFNEQDELKYLKQRSKYFGNMLADINKRIDELEKASNE